MYCELLAAPNNLPARFPVYLAANFLPNLDIRFDHPRAIRAFRHNTERLEEAWIWLNRDYVALEQSLFELRSHPGQNYPRIFHLKAHKGVGGGG
ncbi:hypothetical protein X751_05600 [Mesorhizobium sp. LNJC395A00]|nr:hypothetical protein X751_05600 [Mesorhizobium sp. LNJC395A00]